MATWKTATELYGPLKPFITKTLEWVTHDDYGTIDIAGDSWKSGPSENIDVVTAKILDYFGLDRYNLRDKASFEQAWRDINRASDSREHELNIQAMRMRLPQRFWYRLSWLEHESPTSPWYRLVYGREDAEYLFHLWRRVPSAAKVIPNLYGFRYTIPADDVVRLFRSNGSSISSSFDMNALSHAGECRFHSVWNVWGVHSREKDEKSTLAWWSKVTGRRVRGFTLHARMKSVFGDVMAALDARCRSIGAAGRYMLMVGDSFRDADWDINLTYGRQEYAEAYGGLHDFYIMKREWKSRRQDVSKSA